LAQSKTESPLPSLSAGFSPNEKKLANDLSLCGYRCFRRPTSTAAGVLHRQMKGRGPGFIFQLRIAALFEQAFHSGGRSACGPRGCKGVAPFLSWALISLRHPAGTDGLHLPRRIPNGAGDCNHPRRSAMARFHDDSLSRSGRLRPPAIIEPVQRGSRRRPDATRYLRHRSSERFSIRTVGPHPSGRSPARVPPLEVPWSSVDHPIKYGFKNCLHRVWWPIWRPGSLLVFHRLYLNHNSFQAKKDINACLFAHAPRASCLRYLTKV